MIAYLESEARSIAYLLERDALCERQSLQKQCPAQSEKTNDDSFLRKCNFPATFQQQRKPTSLPPRTRPNYD